MTRSILTQTAIELNSRHNAQHIDNEAIKLSEPAEFNPLTKGSDQAQLDNQISPANDPVAITEQRISQTFITKLNSVRSPGVFSNITLEQALDEIQNGAYRHQVELVGAARLAWESEQDPVIQKQKKERHKDAKEGLPAYALSGAFEGSVSNANFNGFSGIVTMDFDHVSDLSSARLSLRSNPSVVFVFISPSGDGLKVGFRVNEAIYKDAEYKEVWRKVNSNIQGRYPDLEADPSCKDISRKTFASYDPDLYRNFEAVPLDLSGYDTMQLDSFSTLEIRRDKTHPAKIRAALKHVGFICKDVGDYDHWRNIAAGIKEELGDDGFPIFHDWSKQDPHYSGEDSCHKQYRALKRTEGSLIKIGSVFRAAEIGGWDYSIDIDSALASIEDSADFNAIVEQCAEIAKQGLKMALISELADCIISRGKLGHVKTILIQRIKGKAKLLFHGRDIPSLDRTYGLTEAIPKNMFPECHLTNSGVNVINTANNLRRLLDAYDIQCSYDVILKDQKIHIPGMIGCSALSANAALQQIKSLCAMNGIDRSATDYLPVIFNERAENPVLDWIQGISWDNRSRLSDFYDTIQVYKEYQSVKDRVLFLSLIQIMAACDNAQQSPILNKIEKFEYVLTLQGTQGLMKTTWIKSLLPYHLKHYIKTGLHLDLRDKDTIKESISYLICELGELDHTYNRSDVAGLKAHFSKDKDVIRLPYDRASNQFERRTTYIATVNQSDFLRDPTGNRRYLTLGVKNITTNHDIDMEQLWAEIYHHYLNGEQWWPDQKLDHDMAHVNNLHTERSPVVDLLEDSFDLSQVNKGIKYSMPDIRNTMDEWQLQGVSCYSPPRNNNEINLSSLSVSRQVKAHLNGLGFREDSKRLWLLTKRPHISNTNFSDMIPEGYKVQDYKNPATCE